MSLVLKSREDGIAAGLEILGLLKKLQPELAEQCDTFLSDQALEPHFAEIDRRTPKYGERCPCFEGFLSQILKPTELRSNLITFWGATEIWANQDDYAPVCEIDQSLGFIQFGDWCGQTDGEAWVFDSEHGIIGTLSAGLLDYSADGVRSSFESKYNSPWQVASFLACDAWERGWTERTTRG
ncbi:MAG: hypothetical protein AAF591_17050 [Verrucomicrobiota bacterium]